jgi:hypothetical protein
VRNSASAGNGKPKRIAIVHGSDSRAVRGELDRRFAFAKATSRYTEEYRAHVGSDRTVAMDDLCISAARHKALANLAYSKLREGPFDSEDNIRAVYEAFRRADADHRSVLASLGIERRERPIPDLQTYLASKAKPRLTFKGKDVQDAEEVS